MIFSNYSKTELKGIAEKRLNKINQKLENAENPNSESLDDLSLSEFEQYCSEHKDLLDKEDYYIGTWHDPNTETKYLDILINTQNDISFKKGVDIICVKPEDHIVMIKTIAR